MLFNNKEKELNIEEPDLTSHIDPPAYHEGTISTRPPITSSSSSASTLSKTSTSLVTISSLFKKRIRASDTPQWKQSNAQCRDWIAAVLICYCNRDPHEARGLANAMFADKGFGPRLYTTKLSMWERFVRFRDTEFIHGMLLSLRREKEAVPESGKIDGA